MKRGLYKKIIAVTTGDPAGIGPEITLKAIKYLVETGKFDYSNFIIVGSRDLLFALNDKFSLCEQLDKINIAGAGRSAARQFKIGEASRESGAASYSYIEKAVGIVMSGAASALVTAPISKEALKLAGINYSGHTEILQALSGSKKVEMAFYGKHFNLLLLSRHLSLRAAVSRLDINMMASGIVNGARFMRSLFPRAADIDIIVPGLNPHASENGLFGDEEEKIIAPAIARAREIVAREAGGGDRVGIYGPEPADTAFHRAYKSRRKTLLISFYHDQGLIPFKLLHFDSGVNVTIGLPFVRTSPDHGTAFQIAGKNCASSLSMINALGLAFKLKPFELF
jgi:4-hydroxythreonine-4-phosphate dehydrogenase